MGRSAEYPIKGFLYQFNKTLLVILNSADDVEITVEGIVEDIDVCTPGGTKAIQCKYHEAQKKFTLSMLYKPVLQMMDHHIHNQGANIEYILYAHFPNNSALHAISTQNLSAMLQTNNQGLKRYTESLRGKIDVGEFSKRFTLEFGVSFDELVNTVQESFQANGIPKDDIDTLMYPNAMHMIGMLGSQHDRRKRIITKRQLLDNLRKIRSTVISRWTFGLKGKRGIFDARKKQLKAYLDANARQRYFIISKSGVQDFDDELVSLIRDYLDKFHCKVSHVKTPLFCLECSGDQLNDIILRLYENGIKSEDGLVGGSFKPAKLFREPMIKQSGKNIQREFDVRLMRLDGNLEVMNQYKCRDLFIIGPADYPGLDEKDVNVQQLEVSSLKELKYILGVSNVWE